MSGLNSIRKTFLEFFQKNGHEIIASSPLVPHNDPTLMFTNAGMVQFKNIFTGQEQCAYQTAATVQKCIRAGGKHNDLDNVGRTNRHHTFFEMLGNFSFSGYFKERAISLAWDLLTREFNIDRRRIVVTVYHDDEDAFKLWRKISGLSTDRIIRINGSDNFWSMADTGPCGPCSEIFFDRGENIPGGLPGSSDENGGRYVEIWNLVFMQFEQISKQERIALPNPSIDTGMGLERIAAVLQGKEDNYDIDTFRTLIFASEQETGVEYRGKKVLNHRVIVDHLRSSAFLVADGVLPANEGRGYVLRRIMRRAMCHAQLLGATEPLIYRLLPTLFKEMGSAYPELIRAQLLISDTLQLEEMRFLKTLNRGLPLLDEVSAHLEKNEVLDGDVAFKLYDTHGFPLDLMQDILQARGLGGVDIVRFDQSMEAQRAKARSHRLNFGEKATEKIWFMIKEEYGVTQFVGYKTNDVHDAVVQAIVERNKVIEKATKGQEVQIVVNKTPFYAESGGQIGDIGSITGIGVHLRVIDTQKKEGLFVHRAVVEDGLLQTGMPITLEVDIENRHELSVHHSATHLLHWALREMLGSHVVQKGSRIIPERLRFDIVHSKPIAGDEIKSIEDMVNDIIAHNLPVTTRIMGIDAAIKSGSTALFGEKYGEKVRVVSIESKTAEVHSSELCGGTHVSFTGEIMLLRIISESSVSAGVRRIEAVAGRAARAYLVEQDETVKSLAMFLKVQPFDVLKRTEEIWEERRKLQLSIAQRKSIFNDNNLSLRRISEINFIGQVVSDVSPKDIKGLIDRARKKIKSGIIVLVSVSEEGKASVVVSVTSDLVDRFNAVDLVRLASTILGGKGGGGRPDMAQSGGPDGKNAARVIEVIEEFLSKKDGI
ncbi:alanine--tRNA ligase [Candidatus Liberibacter sp.]|uniref:alanine--tRNA ligase n=1 Tax=Candidatus Liberibacter sp. TaxID=34022 RepID=UPI0015F4AC17|nr:alanine--tRNA ligase [Candidatus Liberibacter sp.]MBA5723726.1 alanine--tRNA ligase [Candidatus Liberibacter sp.]